MVFVMSTVESIYQTLYQIYNKHRRQYKENAGDSQQMCLMWSTYDPPDELIGTEPFDDIEATFGICIDNDDDVEELYNAYLRQAAEKIAQMQPKWAKGQKQTETGTKKK